MSEEILIQNLDPDEVVVLDPDNCEELLLGVDSIVILSPSSKPLVTSVNGQTGPVVLGAADVGADPAGIAALLIAQITAASIGAATAAQGAKADAALAAIDAPAAVRDTSLTGLSTATATPVVPTDTVLTGVGKLQAQINLKLDAADYSDRFLGLFASVFDLEAAYPTANAGDYAQVDWGIGVDVIIYAWDVSDAKWAAVGSSAIANTDALPEGSSNLYFTSQRVRDTPLTGLSTATATPITAADSVLSAAGKLQAQISATAAKADAALAAIDAFNPANLSDAGTLLPNDQLVIWRDGVMLRTTVAAFGGGSEPTPTQLMLGSSGAIETADGDYQRFAYDGVLVIEYAPETFYPIWCAELPAQDRQSEYQIKLKMPELSGDQAVNVFITEADISLAALLERDFNYFALELRANDGSTGLLLNIADDQANSTSNGFLQPAAGSVITLTLTTSSLDYVYDGGTGSIDIPAGFFANPPSIWAYSGAMDAADVMPLSIKVVEA